MLGRWRLKLRCYKKLGDCHKELRSYEKALLNYKKELQLAWHLKIPCAELEAYDNIGLVYYYLGDIDKAIYYHNRMMNKQLEEETEEKKWNNYSVSKKIADAGKTKGYIARTFFIEYRERAAEGEAVLPHESTHYVNERLAKEKRPAKTNVVSPKHENSDLKAKIFSQALKNSFLNGDIPIEKYNEIKKDAEYDSAYMPLKMKVKSQIQSRRESSLFENRKIQRRVKQLLKSKVRTLSISNIVAANAQSKVTLAKKRRTRSNYRARNDNDIVVKEADYGKRNSKA
eukprot:TRINITY_DN5885_c0_g1_i5.p1 TRINITY_DN5885_c0_g1~~TRINITY_DN5885_c0_g1_i5.p1  ORF type:complete len:285 (-),score=81.09 TRINITY_DN5885_c0_g1_i5:373-1227(-)